MPSNQGWVTYASNDKEGVKALMLAKSLILSITTRQLIVLISDEISKAMGKRLQKEYSSCICISSEDISFDNTEKKELSFKKVAQLYCWELDRFRQFVFLDCNCLVLKNADELFRRNGIHFKDYHAEESEINVFSGNSTETKMLRLLKDGVLQAKDVNCEDKGFKIDDQFCTNINFNTGSLVTGKEIRIVCFQNKHPLDFLHEKKNGIHLSKFEKNLLSWTSCLIPSDASTFLNSNESQQKSIWNHLIPYRQVDTEHEVLNVPLNAPDVTQDFKDIENSIAIVGMAFRFPGASTNEEFWKMLIEGREGIIKVPHHRWTNDRTISKMHDTNFRETEAGFLTCPIDEIDAKFFGLNISELEFMDPQQRILLHVAYEAVENSGIDLKTLREKSTGVFGGRWRNDYKEILLHNGLRDGEFFRSYMGNTLGSLTARISHCLELSGPCVATESGCSTSIVGVDMAFNSLLEEKCDIALAVASNLLLHPFGNLLLSGLISNDSRCKTFDADADGFGRAEGAAVLVLKRFSDAVADGDKIWALIRGSAVVQEGESKHMGTPTVECEARAMKLALQMASVKAKDVSFVETHGTGTPVGDPLEVAAVAKVYSEGRTDVLTIGSVKTNIGHTESVAGIAGIIKTVLALQNEMIPQHLNLKTLHPDIQLDSIPAVIPLQPLKWKKTIDKPRIAGVSSFGITGTDAHVIIQETPFKLPTDAIKVFETPKQLKILTISAKNYESLEDAIKNYSSYLLTTTDELENIEYTANVARSHYSSRIALLGHSKNEMLKQINKKSYYTVKQSALAAPKIGFLFTGQGSQYYKMAEQLYLTNIIFSSHFDYCESLVAKEYGFSIKKPLWDENHHQSQIHETLYSQTAIFCVQYCLVKLWESWGIIPDVVLGHSLGEFAAAVAAGFFSFETGLKLVISRSQLINNLPNGKMLVVKENVNVVKKLISVVFHDVQAKDCDSFLDIAAENCDDQTVIAGSEVAIFKFLKYYKDSEIKMRLLDATHAFHSYMMDSMLESYRKMVSEICKTNECNRSQRYVKYISGMEGKSLEPNEIGTDYWVRHTRERVRFLDASKSVLKDGCSLFLEIGPHPVLCSMILNNTDGVDLNVPILAALPSIRKNEDNWLTLQSSLATLYVNGVDISWRNYYRYSYITQRSQANLPSYPFKMKSYWQEAQEIIATPIHPLVGYPIPNPSNVQLYKSKIDLGNLHFIKDHVIGNRIIFPGACFLEMCLVAGHAAMQRAESGTGSLAYYPPVTPITLIEFQILSPLCLAEQCSTELQVFVDSNPASKNGETDVKVFSKSVLDQEAYKWINHATAQFLPFLSHWNGENNYINDSFENIKFRCNLLLSQDGASYCNLEEYGLKFGPCFRTIQNLWKSSSNDETLCGIKIIKDSKKYICHPLLIDAMFQALVISIGHQNKGLHVPISVKKFIWMRKPSTETCFIYCNLISNVNSDESYAVLMTEEGETLAIMVGAEIVGTTVNNVMSAIDAQKSQFPAMYEDVWREKLGPFEKRLSNELNIEIIVKEEAESGIYNKFVTEADFKYYELGNDLSAKYMIKALYDLKIDCKIGDKFDYVSLADSCKVQESLQKMLNYILMELADEGFFKIIEKPENGALVFEMIKNFPSEEINLQDVVTLSAQIKDLQCKFSDIECLQAVAPFLSDIISGNQSGLSLLFPEELEEKGPAERYYYESQTFDYVYRLSNSIVPKIIKEIQKCRKSDKTIMRFLEIGAGTGSFTTAILPHLLDDGAALYEYTYTDITPAFFSNGQRIFEGSNMSVIYQTLNIEEDPLEQGFMPHNYDFVFASYVVHTTKNVTETLTNCRKLIKHNGHIFMTELMKPLRITNLIFGCLDGFWRFDQFDKLRPYNCAMNQDCYEKVLRSLDFENVGFVPYYNSHDAIIAAKLKQKPTHLQSYLPFNYAKDTWIVFSDGGTVSNLMIERLCQMGKRVVIAKENSNDTFKNPLELELYSVSESDPVDILKVYDSASNMHKLEGIIFMWQMNTNEKPLKVEINETGGGQCTYKYKSICQPFLSLCKVVCAKDFNNTKLFVFTQGNVRTMDECVNFPSTTPIISMAKALQNESQHVIIKCIDLDASSNMTCFEEGFAELFHLDDELIVVFRDNKRLVCRLSPWKFQNLSLEFPKSPSYRLMIPPTYSIADLKFVPAENKTLDDFQVEVCVKAYALNFRDLFAVLKPDPMFDNWNIIGLDFSGIVTAVGSKATNYKIGDGVIGINRYGCAMPSYLQVNENMILPLPKDVSFNEGATIPTTAITCYVCLIQTAKLQQKDTVLIHSATGGVGLFAIQIAKAIGCRIIATAGSKRKRAYLKHLGIPHVFHSRNTDFQTKIREALNGSGVDVVLNCLTGPGFKEASLSLCNANGRFVEISALNVWTEEEVKLLRPDVIYSLIDLSISDSTANNRNMMELRDRLTIGEFKPLPYIKFDAGDIRQALTYMQKANHIGKIVCVMPDILKNSNGRQSFAPMFDNDCAYLITGGLGGVGFAVAKWMLECGAKHLVLIGRSDPNDKVFHEIEALKARGSCIHVVRCDVGDYFACKNLLSWIKSNKIGLPRLKGIMHVAGLLSDGTYDKQTWEKYEVTYNAKVRGSINLHELTLDEPLEFFVMFSSMLSIFSAIAQSNHASANYFLDSLTQYRRSIGLPALTINWGQWGQVGVATEMEVLGLRPFTTLQGLSALEVAMKNHKTQLCVLESNVPVLRQTLPSCRKYLEEIKTTIKNVGREVIDEDTLWAEYDAAETREDKYVVIKRFVNLQVRLTLKMEEHETIDDATNLQDLGLDSMMMMELKNVIQASVGKRAKITVSAVRDCKTVIQLSRKLVELISGEEAIPVPTKQELMELILEDSQLSETNQLDAKTVPKTISTIFITGVSGNLGPYVLREILKQNPSVTKIVCLIRDNRVFTPKDRFKQILKDKNLTAEIDFGKLQFVSGNITLEKFGLVNKEYDHLAEEVDAIFHLAAVSNCKEFYAKTEKTSHTRIVNVTGMHNVLQFASDIKTKHFFHVSSTNCCSNLNEEWPLEGKYDNQRNHAFGISKYVCEKLLAQCAEKGLPVKVFRISKISGDSQNGGNISIVDNELLMRMMGYVSLKMMPANDLPLSLVPVEICAELIVKVAFNDEANHRVYNITNPKIGNENQFPQIANECFGFKIESLEAEAFIGKVQELEKKPEANQSVSLQLTDFIKIAHEGFNRDKEEMTDRDSNKTSQNIKPELYFSKNMASVIPDYAANMKDTMELLKADLQYAKDSGFFDKIWLK